MRRTRVSDYLCAIQKLCEEGARDRATTGDVARVLEISKGTASTSLKRLAIDGLIEHVPYEGVSLTSAGRAIACRAVTRLRLLQVFLTRSLEMAPDIAAVEASRLEVTASDDLIEQINKRLAHSCFSARDELIQAAEGTMRRGRKTGASVARPS